MSIADEEPANVLVRQLAGLRVYRNDDIPALYQPITLLWAFARARRGEDRLVSWAETKLQVGYLLSHYGRPGEGTRVHYPVAALYGAGIWELDAAPEAVPSAHGSSVPQRWFDECQPAGGLVRAVYDLVRESPEARAAAVSTLIEAYFIDADATELLAELGLPEPVETSEVMASSADSIGPRESRPGDWTETENRAIVDDYLAMLALESAGRPYSKKEHRNALIESMGGTRSAGSIERKHQNISAVMVRLDLPYIKGYKPLPNIQQALLTEVRRRLEADPTRFAEWQPQPASPGETRFSVAASFAERAAQYKRLCMRVDSFWRDRGNTRAEQTSSLPIRALDARLAVLLRSGGHCENPHCTGEVHDRTDKGNAILEVDHIHDLALGGPDNPSQMIALCPNCHAVKTRGSTRVELKQVLLAEARRRHDEMSQPAETGD